MGTKTPKYTAIILLAMLISVLMSEYVNREFLVNGYAAMLLYFPHNLLLVVMLNSQAVYYEEHRATAGATLGMFITSGLTLAVFFTMQELFITVLSTVGHR